VTDYVIPKLPNRVLPMTKGTDRVFTVRRRDPVTGDPIDWDGIQVSISIDIDKAAPTKLSATVTGPDAVVVIESEVGDLTRTGMTWQVAISQAGTPSRETPVLVGVFERNDGK